MAFLSCRTRADGWAQSADGFPAMTERVRFLMKDLVLLAGSFYLLRQDVLRSVSSREPYTDTKERSRESRIGTR
jgi:hypothetical protein